MSTLSMTDPKEDWLIWLEAVAAAAESKEQLHSLVDDAIGEFIKEADTTQRAQFAAALRERQHPLAGDASPAEASRWADWPAVVELAAAKLETNKA